MPFKKISDLHKQCVHPSHDPPELFSLEPGCYEYTCPECGCIQIVEYEELSYGLVKRKYNGIR